MLLAKAGDRLDVNQADKDGVTPLYIACQNGHSACIEMLLAKAGDRLDVNQAEQRRHHSAVRCVPERPLCVHRDAAGQGRRPPRRQPGEQGRC
jgi:ankyrin repeat protein